MTATRRLRQLALAAALGVAGSPAKALEVKDLAGWWMSVDPAIARLVDAGGVIPMEEVLIVQADGAVENRAVKLVRADPVACSVTGSLCSDAPLIARARLKIDGDRITFTELVQAPGPIDDPRVDPFIRVSTLTAVPAWFAAAQAGGERLALRAAAPATINAPPGTDIRQLTALASTATSRILVRIDPDRLRLLRAAMLGSDLSSTMHWRCYVANATAGEPAFAGLLRPRMAAPPPDMAGYLRVAGYVDALQTQMSHPTPDHPHPDTRKAAGTVVENLVVPRFDGLAPPASAADLRPIAARLAYLASRGQDKSAEAAQVEAARIAPDPVTVPLSDAELAAYARLRPDSAASKALFCAE